MIRDELPPTITVEHAGRLLGISRRSAYRAAHRGQIPTLRLGRRLLVPTGRLLALLGYTPVPSATGPSESLQQDGVRTLEDGPRQTTEH